MSFRAKSRNPLRKKRHATNPRQPTRRQRFPAGCRRHLRSASARFSRYGCAYAQNDKLLGRTRRFIWINIINPSVHRCHFERWSRKPRGRDGNNRTRYAAGRGRPALPTATPRIGHDVISSVGVAEVEKSHTIETEQSYTHYSKILARGGSPSL